jgi:hypothetical protein
MAPPIVEILRTLLVMTYSSDHAIGEPDCLVCPVLDFKVQIRAGSAV